MPVNAFINLGSYQDAVERYRAQIPGYIQEMSDISSIRWDGEAGKAFSTTCQRHIDATHNQYDVVVATAQALAELQDTFDRRMAIIVQVYETALKRMEQLAQLADEAITSGMTDAAAVFTEKHDQLAELHQRYDSTDKRWLTVDLDMF